MTKITTIFENFKKNIVILGAGSISVALIPLLFKHLKNPNVKIISEDLRNNDVTSQYNLTRIEKTLQKDNYVSILDEHTLPGDFIVNLTVDVSSQDLIDYCSSRNMNYIDTCIQPWVGFFDNFKLSNSERSNYALRHSLLNYRKTKTNGPTAVVSHGANPGMVNHIVKDGIVKIANELNIEFDIPSNKSQWAELAKRIGLKTIHVSERDSQFDLEPKKSNQFVNTWSVDGFIAEGILPAELGWGTHEAGLPPLGEEHAYGSKSAIFLNKPGCATKVKTWTPTHKEIIGFLITHQESISIAEYLSTDDYRPTVHYAYHPCDVAVESLEELVSRGLKGQDAARIMTDSLVGGMDELGVLFMGDFGSYWLGSQLSIDETRSLINHNNATSLQVVAPLFAAMIWINDNPNCGILEPDELPHDIILEYAKPYLGNYIFVKSDFKFDEKCQFVNFLVSE
jgi:homospermidine synthase